MCLFSTVVVIRQFLRATLRLCSRPLAPASSVSAGARCRCRHQSCQRALGLRCCCNFNGGVRAAANAQGTSQAVSREWDAGAAVLCIDSCHLPSLHCCSQSAPLGSNSCCGSAASISATRRLRVGRVACLLSWVTNKVLMPSVALCMHDAGARTCLTHSSAECCTEYACFITDAKARGRGRDGRWGGREGGGTCYALGLTTWAATGMFSTLINISPRGILK